MLLIKRTSALAPSAARSTLVRLPAFSKITRRHPGRAMEPAAAQPTEAETVASAKIEAAGGLGNGDGREQRLLAHVEKTATKGDPESVLAAIDSFAWGSEWLMNVGDVKGLLLDTEVKKAVAAGAKTFLELGAYCGYSGVRIARLLPEGCQLTSIEVNADFAQVASSVQRHAGLEGVARVVVGDLGENGAEVLHKAGIDAVDFVFIDHWKQFYLRDFKLLKEGGLLSKTSVVVADNLGFPSAPDFVEYIDARPAEFQFTKHATKLEYSDHEDMVGVITFLK